MKENGPGRSYCSPEKRAPRPQEGPGLQKHRVETGSGGGGGGSNVARDAMLKQDPGEAAGF